MTGGALKLSSLAPFAHEWVGGDIHGLSALAGTLYGYAPRMNAVADALDGQVGRLVGAADWRGDAAAAFTTAWSRDSRVARAVGLAADQVGGIVDWLAVSLSTLEAELEAAADEAAAHGVTIGPDGTAQVFAGPTTNSGEARAQQWATAYQDYWEQVMGQARQARNTAAAGLATTGRQIIDGKGGGDAGGMTTGDDLTVGNLLGDLMAAPAAASRAAGVKLGSARSALRSAKSAILKLQKNLGPDTPLPAGMVDDLKTSMSAVQADNSAVRAAQQVNNKVFSALDLRVDDVTTRVSNLLSRLRGGDQTAGVSEAGGADSSGDADGALSKLVDFGKDIPVLDVLAGVAGTYLGTKDAMGDGHQPLAVALPEQAAANAASLAAGALTGGAVAGAVGGTSVVSGLAVGGLAVGGAVAAGTGVLAGGVVAVGVGDFATHMFQEHWSSDIHDHGVVTGVLYGIGHSEVETGQDIGHLAGDVGHTAAHLWDDVF